MTDARIAIPRAPLKTIVLDRGRFAEIAASKGWHSNAEIARALGISDRQADRIVAGTSPISVAFIGGLLMAVPELGFRRVFEPISVSDLKR